MTHPCGKFLKKVWAAQQRPRGENSHAFVPFFDDDHVFTETQLIYPAKASELVIPHGGVDIYFAPCLFRRKRRRTEYALPSHWLFADLDESDPRLLKSLRPTVAWETSRGRYQALWLLDRAVGGDDFLDLNQKVTYYTGADKGGWSSTKVLRVPGSISTKHGDDWRVRLMWWEPDRVHKVERVQKLTRNVRTPSTTAKDVEGLKLPKAPPDRIVRRYRQKLPGRALKLIKATEARGDRSERLWQLYGDLLRSGMKPEQVLVVVRSTVWNKYAGQKRELNQLWLEVNKAAEAVGSGRAGSGKRKERLDAARKSATPEDTEGQKSIRSKQRRERARKLKEAPNLFASENGDGPGLDEDELKLQDSLQTYNDFLDTKLKRPGWMVEGVWSEGAHGVLSGEPKTYKSVISTDLAISVASGSDFLDHFKIPATGPVLMIQEENDPGEFQDRMRRIAESRGLGAHVGFSHREDEIFIQPTATLPIHVMNNQSFDLTNMSHLRWLSRQCVRLKLALIILDPFYLMTPGIDENSAAQVGPVLRNLLKLKQAHGVGIQIIHHYKKQDLKNPSFGAARMSGTGVFHRWFESAVFVETTKEENTVRLQPNHRGHRGTGAIRAHFDLGEIDDMHYSVEISRGKADKAELHQRLRDLIANGPSDEEGVGGYWTLSSLRVAMGLSSSKPLKEMIYDQDLVMEKHKGDGPGRPAIIVRAKTERGRKAAATRMANDVAR